MGKVCAITQCYLTTEQIKKQASILDLHKLTPKGWKAELI